jgi:hypothetical protein
MVSNETFSEKAVTYFMSLYGPQKLAGGIKIINPYNNQKVKSIVREFFCKFYNDNNTRLFVIGINPGRFGGGLTGISFTDPVALRERCKIENDLGARKELSSTFIYRIIERFEGVEKFFSKAFLTALYPLAIIKDGKNYNYYDGKDLFELLREEIIYSFSKQIGLGARRDKAVILGKKNARFFMSMNKEHKFFDNVIVLDHPRYIMQYKLKKIDSYIADYLDVLV